MGVNNFLDAVVTTSNNTGGSAYLHHKDQGHYLDVAKSSSIGCTPSGYGRSKNPGNIFVDNLFTSNTVPCDHSGKTEVGNTFEHHANKRSAGNSTVELFPSDENIMPLLINCSLEMVAVNLSLQSKDEQVEAKALLSSLTSLFNNVNNATFHIFVNYSMIQKSKKKKCSI